MSNLPNAAQARFRRLATPAQTPSWWTLGQVVVGVVFFGYLAFSLLSDAPAEQVTATPTPVAVDAPSTTTAADPTSESTPPASTKTADAAFSGPDAEPTTVAFAGGGTTEVPAGLVTLARSSAAAMQGADRSTVPVVAGAVWATVGAWPDATASDVLVSSIDDESATFRVLVTRASAPAAAGAWTSVKLLLSEGRWVLDPGGA